jgi:hypothetical protein
MRHHRLSWIWVGRIAAVVVTAGLIAYLSLVGLNKADKLASVLGLLVAVAALVVPYLLPSSDGHSAKEESAQSIANTVVGQDLTQVRGAGVVRVQGPVAPVPMQAAPPAAGSVPKGQAGQYVNGVWVGGNLTQVDGADGDVTIG